MAAVRVILAGLALVYIGICGLLFFVQRSLIYFPQPASGDASAVITLQAGADRIKVSNRPRPGSRAVIYFGGNAEDVSLTAPSLADTFPESAIYLLHYR